MRGRRAIPVELTDDEKAILEKQLRTHTATQRDILRARVILEANKGLSNLQIAKELGIEEKTVRKWRKRFLKSRLKGLRDLPRAGAPSAFSPSGETPLHRACSQTASRSWPGL